MSDPAWKTNNRRSILGIDWTNQHGCGGNEEGDPQKLNCQLVLQYMCESEDYTFDYTRDDCTMECFIPTTDNPTCSTPGCPIVDMNITGCTMAGYIWGAALYYDQYNCPHECTISGANVPSIASRTNCEAAGGAWTVHNPTGPWMRMRDGLDTNTQGYTAPTNGQFGPDQDLTRKAGDDHYDRGLHESWDYYDDCYRRERNGGSF